MSHSHLFNIFIYQQPGEKIKNKNKKEQILIGNIIKKYINRQKNH